MIGIHLVMRQSCEVLVSRICHAVTSIFDLFVLYSVDNSLLVRVKGIL
jgi:hypothetical protein